MVDFVLDLIDFNEGVDYSLVSRIVLVYLILLWIFVSIWVFNDARYRFNNLIIASALALLNLVLSFPFLLLYLLIRPSHREEWDESAETGGINIPIANFTGKKGVVISLQLKIDSKKILDEKVDYNLDVVLNNDTEAGKTGRIEIVNQLEEEQPSKSPDNFVKIKQAVKKLESDIRMFITKIIFKLKSIRPKTEKPEIDVIESIETKESSPKPKKKRKRTKKKKTR